LGDDAVPELVQRSPPTSWINRAAAPTVPEAARGTWFDKGLKAYQDGDYFDAHEYWEELWRDYPKGTDRQFLQGLIQIAAAMHKAITQGKPAPAARLLGRGLPRLQAVPERHWGLAVGRLVREGQRAKTALARLAQSDELAPFDPALVPTMVRLVGATASDDATS
jgi:predicted metal-dependent hydrolase